MPFSAQMQDDFSGGIYRGRKAPSDTTYDVVNGLINDEGLPFRRGGSAYYSASNAAATPRWLNSAYFPAVGANRVILASPTNVSALDLSLAPHGIADPFTLSVPIEHWGRGAMFGDILAIASGPSRFFFYGGSLKSASYITGSVSTTAGSATLTGSGTSWLANVDAGMVLSASGLLGLYVVKSVDSNTSITLTRPAEADVSGAGYGLIFGGTATFDGEFGRLSERGYLTVAGERILFAVGGRVYFSERDLMNHFENGDYHDVGGGEVNGCEGRGDNAFVFSTSGVWNISNLAFDAIDSFGNEQHVVQQVSKEFALWDDFGIAAWSGGMILPAVDDVYLADQAFSLQPLTGRIRPLYREYVNAGYRPGMASVHRNHYMLPILNGTSIVDLLVCRLDRGSTWTTWAGHAAGAAFTNLKQQASGAPKLLGLAASRVTNLTACFDPGTATDADGTTSDFQITTRDYPTGQSQPGFAAKVRARYELDSTNAATVAVAFSSDQDDDAFTTLTERGEQDGGTGWADSDGSRYQWAIVGKRRERIRFRLTVAGACTRFVLRSVELLTRPSGRQ